MQQSILFDGKQFANELERNSYVLEHKDSILARLNEKKNSQVGLSIIVSFFLGIVFGIATFNFIVFLGVWIGIPILVSKSKDQEINAINTYSSDHEKYLKELEKEIRTNIVEPFTKRYLTFEEKVEHLSDFINLINHKKNISLTQIDGKYILIYNERERNKQVFTKALKNEKSHSAPSLAKILINLDSETNFETEDYTDLLNQFCECLDENNINYDINELKQKITSEFKLRRAINFEEKLSRNAEEKVTVERMSLLDGFEFEKFIAELFKRAGYNVRVTKKSGDQGADIIVEKDNISTAIQTKKYAGAVSNKAVQEIVAAMKYYDCDKAMVITTSTFTKSAYELAGRNGVQLIDKKSLNELSDSIL